MTLSFNNSNGSFVLTTKDDEAAVAAGLTLSTRVRGPNGESVYYTSNYEQQPEFNPYAVLDFWDEADASAFEKLVNLRADYDASWADNAAINIPAPEGKDYLPYQKAGISYALNKGNVLIGDEPGLGKTIQAIGIANAVRARNILVLCPASIRLNWQREIREWSTIGRVRTYPILQSRDGVSPMDNYVICSYDLARNHAIHDALTSRSWDLMILDEAHYLKSTEASRTQAAFGGGEVGSKFYRNGLTERAERIVGLTGTPLPNRPRECYTIARNMCWEAIDYLSFDAFRYRYNPSGMDSRGRRYEERGRLPELQARLRCNLMVRRLKADVLPQLPDKRYEMSYVEPNGEIRDVMAREKLIDFDPMELFNPDFTLDGTPISTLRREMGEAKIPRVIEHLKFLLDIVEIQKLVVFVHHNSVMDALLDAMGKYGVVAVRGGMSSVKKDQCVQAFAHGSPRIFFGQLDTMEGIDGLQHLCDHAVFAEPAWTPGRNEQCIDRLHRIGQHENVLGQFLIAEGSMDEKVLHAVLGKAHDIHQTLDRRL